MKEAPYGLWESPLTAQQLAEKHLMLMNTYVDRTTGQVYWSEGRPAEGGREVVVSSQGHDVTPSGSNARNAVNGYGGGAAVVSHGKAVFSELASGGVFEVSVDGTGESRRIVPENPAWHYADFDIHPTQSHLVLAIRQDETSSKPSEHMHSLVLIDSSDASVTAIVEGKDFYSAPRWSNSGSQVCWLEWSHPNRPWDSTALIVAFGANGLGARIKIAGDADSGASISQPRWALDGKTLLFLSNATGYYNVHAWSADQGARAMLSAPLPMDCGPPDWRLSYSTFCPLDAQTVLLPTGIYDLSLVDLATGKQTLLALPVKAKYEYLRTVSPNKVVAICLPIDAPSSVITFDPTAAPIVFSTLKSSAKQALDSGYISLPQYISFPAGPDPGCSTPTKSFAYFYPPKNASYRASSGTKPPLILRTHGGPTSNATPAFNLRWQFWTSRGFAVADLDYGGSTGYGREHLSRLKGNWGIVDADDAHCCARYLAEEGMVDGERVIITGESAGGYTTLQAAVRHSDTFAAGMSWFGVGDLALLHSHVHKFESQYIPYLVGGTPDENPDVWRDRSPVVNADKIKSPMLILQGDSDIIVPEQNAWAIQRAMVQTGARCDIHIYKQEGHGWRRAETIVDAYERSLAFVLDVLGLRA